MFDFNAITISFLVFLAGFTGIGIYSARRKRDTPEDYLLASREVNPWLVALSAVATNNSGFMFIGLTGTAYWFGVVESFWLMAGWVAGDYVAWRFVHRRLREQSERAGVNTIPGFLGSGLSGGRAVVVLAALITLVFLGLYSSAQLTAGRVALESFGIDQRIGVALGAIMVVAYCFAGGIRASIWTDAAQSVVMLVSMLILVIVAIADIGGVGAFWGQLEAIDPALTSFSGSYSTVGLTLFVLGWVFAGFGAVGQPHIMIRLMTLDSADNVGKARVVYITWFAVFSLLCMLVGLLARVVLDSALPEAARELAFPMMSDHLLPSVMVGVMLAGLFAATISTADSQVLSCSAAISQDLIPRWSRSYRAVKISTLGVVAGASAIALLSIEFPDSMVGKVFDLVTFAWSGLAASLGPLLVIRSLARPIDAAIAVAMIVGGFATVLIWDLALGTPEGIYAALPGICAGFAIYAVGAAVSGARTE